MTLPFQTSRRVEFVDTDAAGIMHFTGFFRMMEQAEHELLRKIGLGVFLVEDGRTISWPRVSTQCDFASAARFEEVLQIGVGISRLSTKSVTYDFEFERDRVTLATGRVVTACCEVIAGKEPRAVPIPETIVKKMEPYCVGR